VIRPGDDAIVWGYGHDIDSAGAITNEASPFTKKEWTYEKAEKFCFQEGQKIGISVYRDFEIEADDTGTPDITSDSIQRIFGRMNQVNIYTGKITRVEHDINAFAGCSGAIVFLLDHNQDCRRDDVGDGVVRNFAFKI